MGEILHLVTALEAWVTYIVAPHQYALVMFIFAWVWGWTFCAPAFKVPKSERGHR